MNLASVTLRVGGNLGRPKPSWRHTVETHGGRDGAVVGTLASHRCGPGSIPGPGVTCGLSLLLAHVLAKCFLRVLRFSYPLHTHAKFQLGFDARMPLNEFQSSWRYLDKEIYHLPFIKEFENVGRT